MARRHRPLFPLPRPRRNRYAPSSRQSPLYSEHPPKAAIPHAAPLPLLSKSNPLALGFDLVLGASLEAAGIYTAVIFHVGAKSALLRRLFMPGAKKTSSARFPAPPFQLRPAPLGTQLVGRTVGGIFRHEEISILTVPASSSQAICRLRRAFSL